MTGCVRPPDTATAMSHAASTRAACRRCTRLRGMNGVSAATLMALSASRTFSAAQSNPAKMPASGPAKSGTSSAITGRPKAANRAGSPLALSTSRAHCGLSREITCARIGVPAISFNGLSPPPIRRARPPARMMPHTGASLLRARALAAMARVFFIDACGIFVEDDALGAGDDSEALTAHAADQREASLVRELDAPGGETGARDQLGNAHAHRLDHHLRRKSSRGVENLVRGIAARLQHPAGDLVDGIMSPDILHVNERAIFFAADAAVNRAGFEIKRRRLVDDVLQPVEPRRAKRCRRQLRAIDRLHEVAEGRALGAARSQRALFELLLEIGAPFRAHDDDIEFFV